jgi:hypothetical protein
LASSPDMKISGEQKLGLAWWEPCNGSVWLTISNGRLCISRYRDNSQIEALLVAKSEPHTTSIIEWETYFRSSNWGSRNPVRSRAEKQIM